MLELWLATPVELAGLCDEELSITLEDCEGNNYFTLNVTDAIHTDYQIDGAIELSRTEMVGETITTHYVDLEPEALVKLDENINTEMKQEYNLVLIGGPVANTIVQELVDLGKTTFEKWDTSEGELELIADAFADGKHVLIVAGKDRDATTMAALDLVNAL
jgi:S-layer protein (TIGR01564 family)